MHGFVTSGSPASALLHAQGVVGASNHEPATADLLEMTFQAEIRVALGEHLGVDRAMGGVADGAAFSEGFVLEGIRANL